MNLNDLKNRKIKLYGKTRSLSQSEFEIQLQNHDISLCDSVDEAEFLFEGRMLNPYEQNELERLYDEKSVDTINVDNLETLLCEAIDDNKLLMSLKLSNNQERLLDFLTNKQINDTLFLKLIKLFDWKKEGFFESDENRDVTAALISRFYENIEQNHNVQYANMGLLHLLSQSDSAELIEVVASLEPLKLALKNGCDNSTMKILELIALHPQTPSKVLKQFIKSQQKNLHLLLAKNSALPSKLVDELSEYDEVIAGYISLTDELFEKYLHLFPLSLAKNRSLSEDMQDTLAAQNRHNSEVMQVLAEHISNAVLIETLHKYSQDEGVHQSLAKNSATFAYILKEYVKEKKYHESLASNSSLPSEVLESLYVEGDEKVLLALAKNSATPVDTLYQLQLDRRFERAVKENEAFGKYIQSNNIGWEV